MSRARDIANYGDGIDTSSITSGQFDDLRIKVTNVTQHETSIDNLAANPSIALGSNAQFPAGHVIQHKVKSLTTPTNTGRDHDITTSWSVLDLGGAFELTGFSATQGNTLVIQIDGLTAYMISDNTYSTAIAVSTDGASATGVISSHNFWLDSDGSNQNIPTHFQFIYTVPANFTNKTLSVISRRQTGAPANTSAWRLDCVANDTPSGVNRVATANLSVMEIQA